MMFKLVACAALLCASVTAQTTVKGVSFTLAQEEAALRAANYASYETLFLTYDIYDWKARNIIAARPHATLTKLADVTGVTYYVLRLLRDESTEQCPVVAPQGGLYYNVYFSDKEARMALAAVNRATFSALFSTAGVPYNTAREIFKARTLCTMADLASISSVDQVALYRVKSAFVDPERTCYTNTDCDTGDICTGFAFDGVLPGGKCMPLANQEGEGSACESERLCYLHPGLVCVGLSLSREGWCTKKEMTGTYKSSTSRVTVPATAGANVTMFFAVTGLASVPVDVTLLGYGQSTVTNKQALSITLTDPNGATGFFWDGPNESVNQAVYPYLSIRGGFPRDDNVNGKWTVTVKNLDGSATGSLGFDLSLSSRWD